MNIRVRGEMALYELTRTMSVSLSGKVASRKRQLTSTRTWPLQIESIFPVELDGEGESSLKL